MKSGRHHVVVLIFTWILFIIIGGYGVMETQRMALAEDRQLDISLERGLELYARNCSTCHGPVGEGCIGKPLNPKYREDFQGGPDKNTNAARYLRQVITDGRPGTGIPSWVTLEDGTMASYTAMPAWHKDKGGPLNDMHIDDLVNFIMLGDFSKVFTKVKELDDAALESVTRNLEAGQTLEDALPLKDAVGVSAAVNIEGKRLFVEKGCVLCHRSGSRGGSVGPDLSYVGSWGIDRQFLNEWITNTIGKEHRIPEYWRDATLGPEVDTSVAKMEPPTTFMPPFAMTPEELDALVSYLLGLQLTK